MKGSGVLNKQANGKTRARVWICGKYESKVCDTRELAMVWLRDMRRVKMVREANGDTLVEGLNEKVTYGEAAVDYLVHVETIGSLGRRKRVHTDGTLVAYANQVKLLLTYWKNHVISKTTVEAITTERIRGPNSGSRSTATRAIPTATPA